MISGNIKVLLSEDNSGDALFTKTLLNNPNFEGQFQTAFEVDFCSTLNDAAEYLKSNYVDLILLDLNLPDSWGFETFQNMRTLHPDIPIIIISGIHDESVSLHAIQEGARDYIIKGEFDVKRFIQAIQSALGNINSDATWLA